MTQAARPKAPQIMATNQQRINNGIVNAVICNIQIPNSKLQIISKFQAPSSKQFENWNLDIGAYLELGAWCLVLVFGSFGAHAVSSQMLCLIEALVRDADQLDF